MTHYCKNGDEIRVGGVYALSSGCAHTLIAVTDIQENKMEPATAFFWDARINSRNGYWVAVIESELPRDSDGYYLWEGGGCPVPEGWVVVVKFGDGAILTNNAGHYDWTLDEYKSQTITAFRVVSTGEEVKPASKLGWETVPEVPYDGGKLMFDACLTADTDHQKMKRVFDEMKKESKAEYNGGAVSYYTVRVSSPKTIAEPYDAECSDIIEALNMTFAEGEAFKALWRKAAARLGKRKEGYDNGLYDAEKVAMFGSRLVVMAKAESKCNYPSCKCPYDMGADNKCAKGLCTDHLRKGVK